MSIALFALAAVMIVGGIVSVIQGFPYVRLESGLAMTIAGATTASAGAVLLGLAVVAGRLRGLERTMAATRAPETAPPEPPTAATDPDSFTGGMEPGVGARGRPSLAATAASLGAGFGAGAGLGAGAGAGLGTTGRHGLEPTFFDPDPPSQPQPRAVEPLLPNRLPEDARPDGASASDHDLFAAPLRDTLRPGMPLEEAPHEDAPHNEAQHDEARHGTALVEGASPPDTLLPQPPQAETPFTEIEPDAAAATPPPAAPIETVPFVEIPAEEPAPESVRESAPASASETAAVPTDEAEPVPEPDHPVVGTYKSGGNTYVMYANGVIEAETPRGRYTFDSLDELKAFVEAGGETDNRGAA